MITLFTCPKAFTDPRIRDIQKNAIRSWLRIVPRPRIVLFGEEDGIAETAAELGVEHRPDVACNRYGTPLVSDLFSQAEDLARGPILCFVNTDIILPGDMVHQIQRIPFRRFLAVGQRWDADVREDVNNQHPLCREHVRSWLAGRASLHSVYAIDHFTYTRGLFGNMPAFAVGRPAFDNWLIYRALSRGAALVDVTQSVPVLHQNHGYAHVVGGDGTTWNGPEADENRRLAEGRIFDILDCRYELRETTMVTARDPLHVDRRVERLAQLRPALFAALKSWKLRYLLCWMFPSL